MFKKIYVEVTNHCNLKCDFCKTNVRKKLFLSEKNFEKIILKIKNHTKYIYLHVLGEPLLHDNIENLIRICDEHNLKVNITTNGTLLHEKQNKLLRCSNIHQINISLHSQHENLMSEKTFLTNIAEFINLSSNKIFFNLRLWNENDNIISPENLKTIKTLLSLLDFEDNLPSDYTRHKSIKLSEKIFLHIDEKFTWPDINAEKIFTHGKCYGLIDQIGILCDGTVVPCCLDGDGYINLGNIFSDDLENILNGERAVNMRENFKNRKVVEDYCMTCGFAIRNNKS